MKRRRALFLGALLAMASWTYGARGDIADTAHNLSVAGPGDPMSRICVFCHTPHNSHPSTPLWNRTLPTLVYTPYSSSTLQAVPDQPTHASKLCLSCHDGTIALGHTLNPGTPLDGGGTISGRANLTTDLSDDHPVSFIYDSSLAAEDLELIDPGVLAGSSVRLDAHGQLQCTTCHNPHDASFPMFLVMDNRYSALCTTCHDKSGWGICSHATSPAIWNGAGIDPWPNTEWGTVADNACENCHTPHTAGFPERLLTFSTEEENCLSCHNGNVALKDIASDIQKPYRHAVDLYLHVHDPTESFMTMPRHVECQDCHNPHAATGGTASAPNISGALTRVAGVTAGGAHIEDANYQYEVCFRCHADNPNVPSPRIVRQILQPNIRMKFDISNPSSHPVVGPGRNPDVPSLISPLTETSLIYCTDCHASDSGQGAGGSGPRGPHGSIWPFLLEREYRTADNTGESYQAYSLCYKCHDHRNLPEDRSFAKHKKHIEGENSPCSVCHDPHGISSTQGNSINNSHLINFDTSIVRPDPETGLLMFEDLGTRRGRCFLECHGESHSPEEY